MKIIVTSADEAAQYKITANYILSLTEYRPLFYSGNEHNHLWIRMNDIVVDDADYLAPNMIELQNCLNFTKNIKEDETIIVHCHAGVSRSTAIAIAILIQDGMNYKEAFDHIIEIRSCAYPNRKIVELTDDYFRLNGDYIKFYNKWLNTNQTDKLILHKTPQIEIDYMKNLMNKINGMS